MQCCESQIKECPLKGEFHNAANRSQRVRTEDIRAVALNQDYFAPQGTFGRMILLPRRYLVILGDIFDIPDN